MTCISVAKISGQKKKIQVGKLSKIPLDVMPWKEYSVEGGTDFPLFWNTTLKGPQHFPLKKD